MIRLMIGVGCMMMAAGAWAQTDSARGVLGPISQADGQAAPSSADAAAADAEGSASSATAPVAGSSAGAEELQNLKGTVEGLNESYLETKSTVDKLAKIKVTGYVQAQWQHTDTNGAAANFQGGAFAPNSDQRFQVRRGRLKTTYETNTSKYVLQFDVVPGGPVSGGTTTSGGVTLKDAYATLMEPWLKTFSYTMGVFDRPFGFEISYSSSNRESPERTRIFQTLFPGERDMGAKIEINPPAEYGFAQYFNFKGGVFTGLGPLINEIDSEQDLIGRIGFQAPFYDINLAIDGGFSFYNGAILDVNDTAFSISDTVFVRSTGNLRRVFDREVMGVDGQLYYDLPVIGGMSLRGEYLWGKIPGTSGNSAPYSTATTAVYNRDVMGWYATWVQNLGKKFQGVLRYDYYDPNTEVDGDDVRPIVPANPNAVAPNQADLAYDTWGFGLLYHWDENLKFTLYYDLVTNEEASSLATGSSAPFKENRKDNVFTFRSQVKF